MATVLNVHVCVVLRHIWAALGEAGEASLPNVLRPRCLVNRGRHVCVGVGTSWRLCMTCLCFPCFCVCCCCLLLVFVFALHGQAANSGKVGVTHSPTHPLTHPLPCCCLR